MERLFSLGVGPRPDRNGAQSANPAASSGFVAGVYARIDNSRGVFKAPAGTEAALPAR